MKLFTEKQFLHGGKFMKLQTAHFEMPKIEISTELEPFFATAANLGSLWYFNASAAPRTIFPPWRRVSAGQGQWYDNGGKVQQTVC